MSIFSIAKYQNIIMNKRINKNACRVIIYINYKIDELTLLFENIGFVINYQKSL